MTDSTGRAREILLAEDNPGDITLTREALQRGSLSSYLHVVNDGVDIINTLENFWLEVVKLPPK